ncbi:peptide chain release factor N(5)-glutamine methyltransferase [bacterium]|nr:peptide chain release factor N(5)-glutamine methyltransferase [bacterium]MBU1599489.1 peptide chain release factor N(5)-glutamine methyltransferase [bacterium]
MEIRKALYRARSLLEDIGIESFGLDADILLAYILAIDRITLYTRLYDRLSEEEEDRFFRFIARRMTGEPIAYLLSEKEFMGLSFKVTPDVLIPRPETEILVEAGISLVSKMDRPIIIDVGTGSGAIAVSLAKYLKNEPQLFATDISLSALKIAKLNADKLKAKVFFLCCDLLSGFSVKADLIISNLPYVERRNLLKYEPQIALDGGLNGLSFYQRIFSEFHPLLSKNGVLALEIGADQAERISEIAKRQDFGPISLIKDLSGIERVLVTKKLGSSPNLVVKGNCQKLHCKLQI